MSSPASRNDTALIILELLTLLLVISLLRLWLAPYSTAMTTVGMVWLLLALASYVVGEFESTARANYGLTIKTQAAFALTYVAYSGIHGLWSWCEPLRVRFWLGLWLYLTFLAPLIGLVFRHLFPQRVLFVTDFNASRVSLLRWWGFDCRELCSIAELGEWLARNSDSLGRVRGYEIILVDISDVRTEFLVVELARNYFVDFIGVPSFRMAAYLLGPHPRQLTAYSLEGVARRLKRVLDLVISGLLLVLLSPLFLILAVLIKLDSPGPVFYRHQRLGRHFRKFQLLKFRTMFRDADKRLAEIIEKDPKLRAEFEASYKLKNDPRVTKIGRWLRRLSIDELPQLLNVVAGQMSLVGPRPIVEEEIDYYRQHSLLLFRVLPGMTGKWQVSGRTETSYEERVRMDTEYVREWSLVGDLGIILKTVPAVLSRRGAF
ncbi:MAG: sugar transferase [candidate division WOR-3 bacterium]